MPQTETELAGALGEIKGLMQGLRDLLNDQNANMNRRFDDLATNTNRRLDDLHSSVSRRLDDHGREIDAVVETANTAMSLAKSAKQSVDDIKLAAGKSGAIGGGAGGAIVAGGIELIKAFFNQGG